jgi:glycosyltransferase involved in cell wall biosynthesis
MLRLGVNAPLKGKKYLKPSVLEGEARVDRAVDINPEADTAAIESALRKQPLRVVRIIDRLNIGGPAKHVVWLTAGLDPERFETVLIAGSVAQGEGDMSYFASAEGVKPLIIKEMSRELSPMDVLVVLKVLRHLLRIKPDVVHTHKSKAGAVGRVAALFYSLISLRRCRIVHTFHGHIFHSYYGRLKTRLFISIERLLARLCTDRIITISEQQRREILETFHIGRPAQFRVIPLGIDFEEVVERPASLRAELGLSEEEVLIGSVGRLSEVKNHAMLLEAAAKLINQADSAGRRPRVVIIGDGPLRSELQELALRLGIAESVTFMGFRADALNLYADLDVVALTSLNEGTPLTLIEAMAVGRPVAATEVGGVIDILGKQSSVADGFAIWEHGVSAASRDVVGFASALRFLIESPELRREMGWHGRSFARQQFSKKRLVNDIEELYCELTQGPAIQPATEKQVIQA